MEKIDMEKIDMEKIDIEYINYTYIGLLIIVMIILYLFFKKQNIIPKVIYQTYKTIDVPPIVEERWLKLNPDYEYYLYDDNDCYKFLLDYYDKDHADLFKYQIKDGPIKSDFWRVCMLYQFGGIYSDIDIIPLVPIDHFVNSDTTLYTCLDYVKTKLNPHFIAVTPKNPIMQQTIFVYMNYIKNKPYSYWGYSITNVLTDVLINYGIKIHKEGIYKIKDQIIQISQEVCPGGVINKETADKCFIKQDNIKIMNNRDGDIYDYYSHKLSSSIVYK